MPHRQNSEFAPLDEYVKRGAVCAECVENGHGGILQVAWGGSFGYNCYLLKCRDVTHSQILKVGQKSNRQIQCEKDFMRAHMRKDLVLFTSTEMVARGQSAGLFPQTMSATQRQAIALVCIEYGLDPMMMEIMLYHGRVYVTRSARLRKAQDTAELAGIATRPATAEEMKARKYDPDVDHLYLATVKRCMPNGAIAEFEGWGGVKAEEVARNVANAKKNNKDAYALPIVKDTAQHAEGRSISRGLKLGFHLPLPSAEDIDPTTEGNGGPLVTDVTLPDQAEAVSGDIAGSVEKVEGVIEMSPAEQAEAEAEAAKLAATEKPAAVKPPPAKKTAPAAPKAKTEAPTPPPNVPDPPENVGDLLGLAYNRDKRYMSIVAVAEMIGKSPEEVGADAAAAWAALKELHGW